MSDDENDKKRNNNNNNNNDGDQLETNHYILLCAFARELFERLSSNKQLLTAAAIGQLQVAECS